MSYPLDDLCTLSGLPKRTVRYYMQIGLVDRPIGETRAAYYTQHHLEQLLQVKRLSDAGLSLQRIRSVLAGEVPPAAPRPRTPGSVEVRSHVFLAPGIELQIRAEDAALSPEQVRALVQALAEAARQVLEPEVPSPTGATDD